MSEIPVIKSIESFIMFDLPETSIGIATGYARKPAR